jgi:hypothetical protein
MSADKVQIIQIRLATPTDTGASVLSKSIVEYQTLYTPAGFAATVPTPDQIKERMNEGPVWVALENGAMLGTVSAVLKDEKLYIRGMAVDPSARAGAAVGRARLKFGQLSRPSAQAKSKDQYFW